MKLALGSLVLLFAPLLLFASLKPTIKVSKEDPFAFEPIVIDVNITAPSNKKEAIFFDFAIIQDSKRYTIKLIRGDSIDGVMKEHFSAKYLLYPLQSGTLSIPLKLTLRRAKKEAIYTQTHGDDNDYETVATNDVEFPLKPITLQVKPLPHKAVLVGDFTLTLKVDRKRLQPYEPASVQITLEGSGYMPPKRLPISVPKGVVLFEDKPIVTLSFRDDKPRYKALYRYALSASNSFEIAPLTLSAFDPMRRQPYTLTAPKLTFTIERPTDQEAMQKGLIDTIDEPKPFHLDTKAFKIAFGALLLFVAGWISAMLFLKIKRHSKAKKDPLIRKIKRSKRLQALQLLLIAHKHAFDPKKLKVLLEQLQKDAITLRRAKKIALEALKSKEKQ